MQHKALGFLGKELTANPAKVGFKNGKINRNVRITLLWNMEAAIELECWYV